MTTTVIVQAHCASNKKVDITMKHESGAKENFDLEDGETQEFTVYDLKEVSVREVVKIYKVTTGEREGCLKHVKNGRVICNGKKCEHFSICFSS